MKEFNIYKDVTIPQHKENQHPAESDMRKCRPLEANISVVLLDIQAELTTVWRNSLCTSDTENFN